MTKALSILLFTLLFLSCEEPTTVDCCVEPAGGAHYYISNKTSTSLKVSFITSVELGKEHVDSVSAIETDQSRRILEDGIIGVNPVPSNSFSSFLFIRLSDSAVFEISEIVDSDWTILSQDFEEGDYGLTEYELEIYDSDF